MVDIHCHVLPGLDDGPESLEMSIAMCEMAIADGITHVIATPHADASYAFQPDLIRRRRDELQARFEGRVELATGCDFHLSFENIEDLKQFPSKYTLNQKRYLLVEFNDYSIPPAMDQTLHHLQLYGATPIITHPERNPLIRNNTERLYRWIRTGLLRADHRAIDSRKIRRAGDDYGGELAERWRGAFFCQRRAQRDFAAFAIEGGLREGGFEERQGSGRGTFCGQSASSV